MFVLRGVIPNCCAAWFVLCSSFRSLSRFASPHIPSVSVLAGAQDATAANSPMRNDTISTFMLFHPSLLLLDQTALNGQVRASHALQSRFALLLFVVK